MVRKTFIETNDVLSKATMIKNLLNPYIAKRLDKIPHGESFTDEWLNDTIRGCEALVSGFYPNIRKTLPREHAVNYILQERGIGVFGVTRSR